MTRQSIPVTVRQQVIERDKATCQVCGKVGTVSKRRSDKPTVFIYTTPPLPKKYGNRKEVSFHFHHRLPVFFGGSSDDIDNIELRCPNCHNGESFAKIAQKILKKMDKKQLMELVKDL